MINIVTFPMQSASITSQVSLLFINFHEILRIREQKATLLHFLFFLYCTKLTELKFHFQKRPMHIAKNWTFQARRGQTVINKHPCWPSFLQIEKKMSAVHQTSPNYLLSGSSLAAGFDSWQEKRAYLVRRLDTSIRRRGVCTERISSNEGKSLFLISAPTSLASYLSRLIPIRRLRDSR